MITCTPVLGGRKLGPMVPESPFLTSGVGTRDTTPLMKGIMMRTNGDTA